MLGSLARKLRIFGFDTAYFRSGTDSELQELARGEERLVLTSDRRLLAEIKARGLDGFLVQGRNERERIRSIAAQARGASFRLPRGPTRCAFCNESLDLIKRRDLAGRLPEGVLRRHRLFYSCAACGRLYWKGGQWTRLRRLDALLRQ